MKPALVKFTVDLYAPGAIISPQLTNYLSRWKDFHSRHILWPVMEIEELLDIDEQGSEVLVDFAHIRATIIMDGWDGITDGPLDRLLAQKRMDEVFDLALVQGIATMAAPSFQLNKSRGSWVGLYDLVDDKAQYLERTTVHDIASLILKDRAPTE